MSADPGAGRRRIYLMRHAEVSYFTAAGEPVDPRHVVLTERVSRDGHHSGEVSFPGGRAEADDAD